MGEDRPKFPTMRKTVPPSSMGPLTPSVARSLGDVQPSERILFVDDEPAVRKAFRRAMRSAGLEVDLAAGMDEALAILRRAPYGAVVCDLFMPQQDGLSLMERMRRIQPFATYALITGADQATLDAQAHRMRGLAAVLHKPWDNEELATVLRRCIATHTERVASLMRGSVRLAGKVLVVSPDDGEALTLRDMVRGAVGGGADIVHVHDLDAAGRAVERSRFEAQLVDVALLSGEENLGLPRLVSGRHAPPLVLLTEDGDEGTALDALQAGAQDYLPKNNIDPPSLLRAIRYAMDRKRAQDRLSHIAHYDQLTGVANRAAFRAELTRAMALAEEEGRKLSLLYLDLDRFKLINDTLGHDVGDSLLAAAAMRLNDGIEARDFLARLGGDEFGIIAGSAETEDEANLLTQRLLAQLQDPFELAGHEICVTASVGIALYPDDGLDIESLLKHGDAAMYTAKARGSNTYGHAVANSNGAGLERIRLEGALRQALKLDQYRLYYQPKIDAASGKVLGVEALIRWQRDDKLVPPFKFIPILEDTGMIVTVGRWVTQTACEQAVRWNAEGHGWIPVSVNLSARQFEAPNLANEVQQILAQTGCPAEYLELELTESLLMADTEATMQTLAELKRLGVKVSVDDFGTGYSSLAYLKRFPLDWLKVDRSFVKDIPDDADDAAIASAIIAMAHSLRLGVIAEGVETEEQLAFLRDKGCEVVQGYFYSKPLPADEFIRWLGDYTRKAQAASG